MLCYNFLENKNIPSYMLCKGNWSSISVLISHHFNKKIITFFKKLENPILGSFLALSGQKLAKQKLFQNIKLCHFLTYFQEHGITYVDKDYGRLNIFLFTSTSNVMQLSMHKYLLWKFKALGLHMYPMNLITNVFLEVLSLWMLYIYIERER